MGSGGHVADHEVEAAVVIDIGDVGSHGEPAGVGQVSGGIVLKANAAVCVRPLIDPETVGVDVVVGHKDVTAPVTVGVENQC